MLDLDDIIALANGENLEQVLKEELPQYDHESSKRLLKNWKKFAGQVLSSPHREVQQAAPLETDVPKEWIRSYMAFRLKYAEARIEEGVTVQTLLKEFQQIMRTISKNTGTAWLPKDKTAMKQFIQSLKFVGASTASRPKAVAYRDAANEIMFYLWNCSEKQYLNPRAMVQFSFYLDIIAYWGLRPGEVVESSSHRGSNEGIHYGDIMFSLVPKKGMLVYQIHLMLRNRKFARDDKSKIKYVPLTEHTVPQERYKCPVRKFLALALADDVFVDEITPESLDSRCLSSTAGSRQFEVKPEKKNLPILRKFLPNGQASPTKIWTAMSVNTMMGSICKESGYTEPVTTYSFRRGVANKMEATTSSKSTKEALGHKGDRTWHTYAAPKMTADAQAIANDMPEDVDFSRYSGSIAFTRDFGAPKPHGSRMGMSTSISADVLEIARSRLSGRKITKRALKRRAYRVQHEKECAEYMVKTRTPGEQRSDIAGAQCDLSAENVFVSRRPEPSAVFKHMLKYNPLQVRVIETLWTAEQASFGECVKAMMAVANPEPPKLFYPHPVLPPQKNGECPYCFMDLFASHMGHHRRAAHLLRCHQYEHLVSFCLQCAMFVDDRLWNGHQCLDLDMELEGIYGVILWRGLVIGEGRCPYGAGRICEERRWRDVKLLNYHIESAHLREKEEGAQYCPAEGCGVLVASKDSLREHFDKAHRIHRKVPRTD